MAIRSPLKQSVVLGLLALLLSGCGGSDARPAVVGFSLESFTNRMNQRIPQLMNRYDIPGVAIALVDEGDLKWSEAFGLANIEGAVPMTVDTVSRTESISKSVTAWGVMNLVEDGVIDLDAPALDYIESWEFPESPYAEETITVRQLLSHTAGLPLGTVGVHYPPQGEMPTLEENLSREASLIDDPGSRFVYSNVGFNLLELVVEGATGTPFAEYMRHEVLIPLGMENASFEWGPEQAMSIPDGHDLAGEPVPAYVYPEKASGGLLAPVEDVARFVAASMVGSAQTGGGVLQASTVEALHRPRTDVSGIYRFVAGSYGLGHFLETLSNGRQAVWHGGQGDGWMTHFHSVPETGDGIVLLTNSQRSWPMIAAILDDWSEWVGASPVAMTIITTATKVLWVVSLAIFMVVAWGSWRLFRGAATGKRRFAPLSDRSRMPRAAMASLAALLLAVLIVGVTLDLWAFFLTPLFPIAAPWFRAALIAAAVVLLAAASTPREKSDHA